MVHNHIEVIHPVTGNREVWTTDRVEAYWVNYRVRVHEAPPVKPKIRRATKKTAK